MVAVSNVADQKLTQKSGRDVSHEDGPAEGLTSSALKRKSPRLATKVS